MALVDGRGVCLVAVGNVSLVSLGGVVTRPVHGLAPSRLTLAARADDRRSLVLDCLRAARKVSGVVR